VREKDPARFNARRQKIRDSVIASNNAKRGRLCPDCAHTPPNPPYPTKQKQEFAE
jgi:hypothetical protein